MDIARELGIFQTTVIEILPDAWLHTYDYCRCSVVFSDDYPPRMQLADGYIDEISNRFF
jgi:hypothetical protein